jgi:hypothetical protein
MDLLKQRILRGGVVSTDSVLKVDSFLNHQIDMTLVDAIAAEFQRIYEGKPFDKVLTIIRDMYTTAGRERRKATTANLCNKREMPAAAQVVPHLC